MEKKYVINVDFPTTSRIHLNSDNFSVSKRCIKREKKEKNGGWVEYSESEIRVFLEDKKQLFFGNRLVKNLTTCSICAKLPQYDFPHIEPIKKLVHEIRQTYELEYEVQYDKIRKFLSNVKEDIHKIVNNLHYVLLDENKKFLESFKTNLWVFDRSIEKGMKELPNKKYQQGLIDHGFHSPEIERKMEMYEDSRNYEFPQEVQDISKEKGLRERFFGWIGKNLSIINVILGSLSSIIPALGTATEYKETIEHAVNYSYA